MGSSFTLASTEPDSLFTPTASSPASGAEGIAETDDAYESSIVATQAAVLALQGLLHVETWAPDTDYAENQLALSPSGAYTSGVVSLVQATSTFTSGSTFSSSDWLHVADIGGGDGGTSYSAGTGLELSDGTFSADFGTASGTVAEGNDSRITGALQAANSLSDVASASTARTNLGLGSAATEASSAFDAAGAAATAQSNAEAYTAASYAPLASPALTGTPTAPTAAALTDSTRVATTAYTDSAVAVEKSRAETAEALLAPLASPALTGTPTAPTASGGTNTTQVATTAFVETAVSGLAPTVSPALTGTPTAPTAAASTDTTQVATTAFVGTAVANYESATVVETNKRITKRVLALSANSATPSIDTDNYDVVTITGQTAAITSFSSGLSGTPVAGDTLRISVTGTASVALTWGSSFESSTVALPTTTSGTTRLDIGFFWNAADGAWRCVGVA